MRTALVLALAAAAGATRMAGAADLPAASRVDAVTVYRQGARVTRVAKVELPGGPVRILLDGLPLELDDDSIRVDGRGARAKVYGVTAEVITAAATVAAEARALEQRLEVLQDEDRGLVDRIQAAQARAKFVESLRSTYSEERAKNLAVRPVTAKEWSDLAGFVESALAESSGQVRKAEAARRELARRLGQARADLEKVNAKRGAATKRVAVEVESDRAGPLELAISYAVGQAGWQPIWDARLDADASTMNLAFLGSVWNRTGEDWANVALAVSTAQPQRGLYVPEVASRWLERFVPPPVYVPAPAPMAKALRKPSAPAAAEAAEDRLEEQEGMVGGVPARMQPAQAAVEAGLLSATFKAPRRETVDGAGQARKVALATFPLKADLVRIAAPRNEEAAFLVAKAVNETGFPLLAGSAGVYVGDEFVGRAALPATPPGGEIELAFGADDRVEVARKVLERRKETAGVISKDEVMRYRVRVTVKNRYATPVAVRLLDLVPVSRDENVKVAVLEGTTKPTREDPERPGVRIHELTLPAKGEQVVELRYEVRWPKGFPIQGLE
ncbi:MAG: mucoidy inhibitor MuiA family protein [Anaeromyxobacter sp.]